MPQKSRGTGKTALPPDVRWSPVKSGHPTDVYRLEMAGDTNRFVLALLAILAALFHRFTVGAKVPQPEPEPVLTRHPNEVEAAKKEKP